MAKPEKIAVPEDLTKPFAIPADWTPAMIEAAAEQVRAEVNRLLDANAGTADADSRVAKSTWLLDTVDALVARQGEIQLQEQAAADALEQARQRLNPADAAADAADAAAATDDEDDEHRDGDAPADNAAGDGADAAPAEPVLVASARHARLRDDLRRAVGTARGIAPVALSPTNIKSREAYLTAAADVPGFTPGQKIDWEGIGKSAARGFESLQHRAGQDGFSKVGIGAIHVPADEQLVASGRPNSDGYVDASDALDWAVSPERLRRETGGDSLVAAGGWCAPSETLYDLLDLTTAEGLLDVPAIQVNRGGVRYSVGPNFSAVYSSGGLFTKTEAQAIAGSAKPVVNIPCPAFNEYRMLVDGMFFTGDILSQKGYPEAYADFLAKAGKAFQHYQNAATINAMATASTVVDLRQPGSSPTYYDTLSATTELLGSIELQILDMQYRNRLARENGVELVLPFWARGVIRSDLSKRSAVANPADISDAQIDAFFTQRGANVQYVYDWQDFFNGGSGFGSASAILSWPTTVKYLIYPAGTFVRAMNDVIELNAVYDSTLLTTNQYVALFMEQGRLVLMRGWDARVVQVNVPSTGAVGAAIDYTVTSKQPQSG